MTINSTQRPAVGVYLGSRMGHHPEFQTSVQALGQGLVELGWDVVYGGGAVGLMGVLAETVKAHGGKIVGVITEHLMDVEKGSTLIDELHVMPSMYERKALIHQLSSQFIVMPGGLGTFDELFETWCAIKIGALQKPMSFVNVNGYFDPLFEFLHTSKQSGFFSDDHTDIPTLYPDVASCLQDLTSRSLDAALA